MDILTDDYKMLFRQAIDKWGKSSQILMAYEECGELIHALAKMERGRDHNVIEEIADVILTTQQLRLMFGPDEVDKIIEYKMERLRENLNVKGE